MDTINNDSARYEFTPKERQPLKNWSMSFCFDTKVERSEFVKRLVDLDVAVDFCCSTVLDKSSDKFVVEIEEFHWLSNIRSIVTLLEELGYD